jgi:hypothetical protein
MITFGLSFLGIICMVFIQVLAAENAGLHIVTRPWFHHELDDRQDIALTAPHEIRGFPK